MTPIAELKIRERLQKGEALTKYEAAKVVPCHHRTAQRVLSKLHRSKLVFIQSWETSNNQRIGKYSWGSAKDVAKPAPLSRSQLTKNYRSRPEVSEKISLKKKAKRMVKKASTGKALNDIFNLLVIRNDNRSEV